MSIFFCNFAANLDAKVKRLIGIILVGMTCVLYANGQDLYHPDGLKTAAGTEFYCAFTTHEWYIEEDEYWSDQTFADIYICTVEATNVTITAANGYKTNYSLSANTLKKHTFTAEDFLTLELPIHITSTNPCYVNMWSHGKDGASASAILPVHMLGKQYMLQGIPGTQRPTGPHSSEQLFSAALVIGTADTTRIRIKAPKNAAIIAEGSYEAIKPEQERTLTIHKGGSLYIHTEKYNLDISGTLVTANKPIAVFQGNSLTQFPAGTDNYDGLWEQVRPITGLGKDFVIAKSKLFKHSIARITAIEDNTEVYDAKGNDDGHSGTVGAPIHRLHRLRILQAGETYERDIPYEGDLIAHHLQTSKPAYCYIYSTGSDMNNGVGDPGIAEIVPLDVAATEARWALNFTTDNAPYTSRLLVSTQAENADYLRFNGTPLGKKMYDGWTRFQSEGIWTWEIPIESANSGILKADRGGFSAYIVHVGKTAEASLFNIALPFIAPDTAKVRIEAPDTVCIDTKNIFRAIIEPDSLLPEPIEYQWYFSPDSVNWTAVPNGNDKELKLKAKVAHTGWYRVDVTSRGELYNVYCCASSEPHKLYVIPDCPPIMCEDGTLLLREEYNAPTSLCDTTLYDLCANKDLSFIVNLPSPHPATRLMLRLSDPETGRELAAYDTGEIPSDSTQAGTNYTIPEDVNSLRWTIRNNMAGAIGVEFTIENIEVRLCIDPIEIRSSIACRKQSHVMRAVLDNYGSVLKPEYQWFFSSDSAGPYTPIEGANRSNYIIQTVHRSHEGWYRAAVSEEGQITQVNCRGISAPFHLQTQYCNTAEDQQIDTTICDTLMTGPYLWRGHTWTTFGTQTDTIKDFEDDDSVYVHLNLHAMQCCPEVVTVYIDSAICDTLLPFMWMYEGQMLPFRDVGQHVVITPHHKWTKCDGTHHILRLDTFHCERLYPLIVNKYNWQLLCDNVALRRFFPDHKALGFQWYKNGEKIPGATEDDYAEQNELHGAFQLYVQLDGDAHALSQILELGEAEQAPVQVQIFNSQGMPVSGEPKEYGIYLYHYKQGKYVWTEKKLIHR